MNSALITTIRLVALSALALALTGCTQRETGGRPPGGGEITFTPRGELRPDPAMSSRGRVPGSGEGVTPVRLDTGWFALTGDPVPGTAAITNAIVWDPFASDVPPFGTGGLGDADVTVSGTRYLVHGAEAFVAQYTDEEGTTYLILSAFSERMVGGEWWQENVAVFVLASDFSAGGVVALDGVDRVGVFAAGPQDAPEPTIFAAAVTGTVTFGAASGAAIGDRIDATIAADFAPAMPAPMPMPGGTPLAAGVYDLVIDPASEVFCGGTMAGHEASFAAETLAVLGAHDGPATLSLPAPELLEISGGVLGAAFGDPAVLDAVANPPDTYVGIVDLMGDGPDATVRAGAYVLVDGLPADPAHTAAAIGIAYVDPAGDGGCDVVFHAELRAR
jgi:hypothetical protein